MELSVIDAAYSLGVSVDTVRRRLRKGELTGRKNPRPQGFVWTVSIGEKTRPSGQPDKGDLMTALRKGIEVREQEREAPSLKFGEFTGEMPWPCLPSETTRTR